jgi:lipid II:glycine glycyltransferase (peptidoglycan interpeptide bridge formation enzyme)
MYLLSTNSINRNQKRDKFMTKIITYPEQTQPSQRKTTSYKMRFSASVEDEAWDVFLRQTEVGDLLQSSQWARLKQHSGWQVRRMVIESDGCIVAGAQLLLRTLPFPLGKIAYLPRGPVLARNDPDLVALVLDQLKKMARTYHLQLLILQPPFNADALVQGMSTGGYQPTAVKIAPRSTLRIDLRPSHDEILAQMHRSTRANVRRSSRKGIVVRQGSEADLGVFMQLHAASSVRQGFSTASEAYYEQLWRLFAPSGKGVLFISEFESEPVSAFLAVGFGKVVWGKRFGWSGAEGKRYPNEGLLWAVMNWAKSQGYHWFDQDGVKWEAAEAIANHKPVPESVRSSASNFKLGFGGEPLLFPKAHVYLYNPVFRHGYTSLFPKLARWPITKKFITRLRLS